MRTIAENLIEMAQALRMNRGQLIIADETLTESQFAKIKLALLLMDSEPVVKLRAIVEDWGNEKIVREMY